MKNMNTKSLLQIYFLERNSSESTQRNYKRVVKSFENHTNQTLQEILNTAETEEQQNIKWQKSTLYYYLISFRKYLYETVQPSTAKMNFTVIKTILRYFGANILPLQSFSTKKYHKVELTPEDIITPDELKVCINVKNPLVKAISLTMSSDGESLIDVLNKTIFDYVYSTREYHNLPCTNENIMPILHKLNSMNDVIPVFEKQRRQKTGVQYTTFCSPEAAKAINNYLIYREKKEKESVERYNKKHPDKPKIYNGLQLTDQLFKGNHGSIERMFREVNEAVGLGKAGNFVKFAPHMMRRYHTTQLYAAGFSEYEINLLQGRKSQEVIHRSYLRVKLSTLKEKYIQALPFLVVDDVYRVKTELEVVKEDNERLHSENNELKKQNKRIDDLEKIVLGNIDDEKLSKLHKLL